MALNLGGWIHSFTVTDTQQHKGGYTIYKITSIVFPRSVPQALTCLVVWKRFHEIKRLHRELSRRHKSMQLPGKLPEPTDSSYFKRFDADVIQRRKDYILLLLDFAAQHPALYKCNTFTQFFSEAQSPNASPLRKLYVERSLKLPGSGAIAEIRDKLDLNYDPQDTLPSTDSDANQHPQHDTSIEAKEKQSKRDYTRLLTPMASVESEDSDYIYEAALEFSHAVQSEVNLEYEDAHKRYKRGVELLLVGAKHDANEDRKFIAKAKIAKYLARADDIYANFLSSDAVCNRHGKRKLQFQLSLDEADNVSQLECPWNQLAKYKVLQVLGERVMQVQCITQPLSQPAVVMKGIEKPASNSPTQSIFLPQRVPYMCQLLAYFQSDQKIFLLLKQAEGGRLFDYIQSYTPTASKCGDYADLFPAEQPLTTDSDVTDLLRNSQQLLRSVSHTLSTLQAGTLTPRRLKTGAKRLPEVCLRQWACELAVAVHSLHGKGVILRDLHMENILLGKSGQLMLTYFYQNEGLSSDDNYVHKALSLVALNDHFVAPERPLTFRSDWWSYGMVLYQLLLGVSYKSMHPGQLELYGCVQYPSDALDISDNARDLLEQLLQLSPELRLDYEQLQAHPFFDGIDWQKVREQGKT
ncbi:ribosomal protein S6 kinase-like 1 [Drosophila virilis]|uniref:ribosomal protein S6 kinase-like 1 n=1 Tax=Drosophila virilis TaxID=7244 RepID=UPI00017D4D9C|nr:ribosomal protein S6 kinase delta-1 [Drosophila virilis]